MHMGIFAYIYVYALCGRLVPMYVTGKGHWISHPLELELWVISHHVDVGFEPGFSSRTTNALNC